MRKGEPWHVATIPLVGFNRQSGAELHAAEAADLDRHQAVVLDDLLEILLDGELAVGDVVLLRQADLGAANRAGGA